MSRRGQWDGLPLVFFSTGPNAREVKCLVDAINRRIGQKAYHPLGFVAETGGEAGGRVGDLPVLCGDSDFPDFAAAYGVLGVVLPMAAPLIKRKIYERLKGMNNLVFPVLIHPDALLLDPSNLETGMGCIVMGGAVVSTNVRLGDFVYLNYNCTVGHDTAIGDFCSINPMAAVSGGITVGGMSVVGAASSIMQGLEVGEGCNIGLGAFVVKDVPAGATMVCRPAQAMKKKAGK